MVATATGGSTMVAFDPSAARTVTSPLLRSMPVILPASLASFSANLSEIASHGATYVDKILKGARPGELPIEQPTRYDLVINLKTAKALGLTIPPSLLARADQVIE